MHAFPWGEGHAGPEARWLRDQPAPERFADGVDDASTADDGVSTQRKRDIDALVLTISGCFL